MDFQYFLCTFAPYNTNFYTMIDAELLEKNYEIFKKKIEPFGVTSEKIDEVFGDKLKLATFTPNNEDGLAYDGSLLNVILRTLTPFALKIADIIAVNVPIEKDSIIKVALLHQISKAVMFEKNDNQWEIEKRGLLYKYAPSKAGLKMGLRSLLLCQDLGVKFTEDEFEAMCCLDRLEDDKQAKFFSTPLSNVIRQANELTYIDNKYKNKE